MLCTNASNACHGTMQHTMLVTLVTFVFLFLGLWYIDVPQHDIHSSFAPHITFNVVTDI